jgi:hypothetical protein
MHPRSSQIRAAVIASTKPAMLLLAVMGAIVLTRTGVGGTVAGLLRSR